VLKKLPLPLWWQIVTADMTQSKEAEVTDAGIGLPSGG